MTGHTDCRSHIDGVDIRRVDIRKVDIRRVKIGRRVTA